MSYKFFHLVVLFVFLLVCQPTFAQSSNEKTDQPEQSLIAQLFFENMTGANPAFGPIGKLLDAMDNTFNNSETYQSIKYFWYNDIFDGFLNGLVQTINQFLTNIRSLYLPSIITWLCSIVKQFFTNLDLTQIEKTGANSNDFALMLKQFNDTIFSIAIDLSLLLFILSIWRYWADAAWKGNGNLMSPVGRLIFAVGTMLAWPNIYSFQIQLSNGLMSALFLDQNGNIQFLDLAMARLFDSNNTAVENLFSRQNMVALSLFGANSSFFIEYIIPIIFCFLTIVLISQLVYVIILKAIQTALMTAQYVFAPIFLVLLANPVTDSIATSYIRTFVEVSLWNFIWIGLLKILIILLYSNFNPWGKLLTCIGILQIMMDAPQFLAHAKISVASDFVSPRFLVKSIKDIGAYNKKLESGVELLQTFFGTANERKRKDTRDSQPPELQSLGSNFNFASNNDANPNLSAPVSKSAKKEQAHNQSRPETTGSGSSTIPSFSANSFGLGSSSSTNRTFTATSANGSGIAIASANSTATALAIALASINNPGQGNQTSPPTKPEPPKPGPVKPGPETGSDPKSSGSKPVPPNPGPLNTPQLPIIPQPLPPGQNLLPSALNTLHPVSQNKLAEQLIFGNNLQTEAKVSQTRQNPVSKKSSLPQNTQLGSEISHWNSKIQSNASWTTDRNQESAHNRESVPNHFSLKNPGQNTDFIGKPALIFNHLYAFHTGAMNYHSKKSKRNNPLDSMYFLPFDKQQHEQKHSFCLNSNNLIFAYGNIPTLMGIPPIYPKTNKT